MYQEQELLVLFQKQDVMVNEIKYISLKEILSRVLRHPLLQDVDLDSAIQYTVDFIAAIGMPIVYTKKEEQIEIKDYRGKLPCDLLSINQVKGSNGICLRRMTDSFVPSDSNKQMNAVADPSYMTRGDVIFTSFKDGEVSIAYNAQPVDRDGVPMLVDNPVFLKALELYIKKEVFTTLFDMGRLSANALGNTQTEYAFKVAQCRAEFNTPSVSEMESIKNMWTSLIQDNTKFRLGFKTLGNQEYIKVQ